MGLPMRAALMPFKPFPLLAGRCQASSFLQGASCLTAASPFAAWGSGRWASAHHCFKKTAEEKTVIPRPPEMWSMYRIGGQQFARKY